MFCKTSNYCFEISIDCCIYIYILLYVLFKSRHIYTLVIIISNYYYYYLQARAGFFSHHLFFCHLMHLFFLSFLPRSSISDTASPSFTTRPVIYLGTIVLICLLKLQVQKCILLGLSCYNKSSGFFF